MMRKPEEAAHGPKTPAEYAALKRQGDH